jgi:hypothetical protein
VPGQPLGYCGVTRRMRHRSTATHSESGKTPMKYAAVAALVSVPHLAAAQMLGQPIPFGRYMSERLGDHIVWRKQRTFNQETQKYEEEWMPQGASFLRTGIELGREVSRDCGNQVIFVEGGDSFLLRRRPYDKTFKREQYSPDPSEPERLRLLSFRDWRAAWDSGVDSALGRVDEFWRGRRERSNEGFSATGAASARP